MAQSINVDMTPGLFMPTLHYSQGDIGREFVINLATRDGMTIPAGATVTMQATKPSGFGFSVAGSLSGTVATFTSTAEMTDESGRFQAEIVIAQGTTVIGTTNFWLEGEKNPHPEGTIDGSEGTIIPELTLLVERVEKAASDILDMTVEAETLAAGSQATYSYDEDTNTATFGIPQGEAGAGAAGVVASAYSSSKTYAVGDYVIHNSNLYRCTTAITTAESFTAAHWTQVVLGDDVSDLKADIDYNTDAIIGGGTLKSFPTGGAVRAISVTSGTDYVVINLSDSAVFTTVRTKAGPSTSSTTIETLNEDAVNPSEYCVISPSQDASYMYIYCNGDMDIRVCEKALYDKSYRNDIALLQDNKANQLDVDKKTGLSIITESDVTFNENKRIMTADGSEGSNNAFRATKDFIDVAGCDYIEVTLPWSTATSDPTYGCAFYTAEEVFIASFSAKTKAQAGGYFVAVIAVPPTAKYFKTTWWSAQRVTDFSLQGVFSVVLRKSQSLDSRLLTVEQNETDVYYRQADTILPVDSDAIPVIPSSVGVYNAVRNARQLTDIVWTPVASMPGLLKVDGVYTQKNFPAGIQQRGIPYSGVHAYDNFVGFNILLDTWQTAVQNPNSVLYTMDVFNATLKRATYYGIVCSKFAQYALGVDGLCTTNEISSMPNLTKVANSGSYDEDDIEIGDILNLYGVHTAVVTGLFKTYAGAINYIEVSEAVTPLCRRVKWSVTDFFTEFAGYDLYRYDLIDDVQYHPCAYVNVDGSGITKNPNQPIKLNYGDKRNVPVGTGVSMSYDTARWKGAFHYVDNTLISMFPLTESPMSPSSLQAGVHKLVLIDDNGILSEPSYFNAISATISHTVSGDQMTITYSSKDTAKYIQWTAGNNITELSGTGSDVVTIPSGMTQFRVGFESDFGTWFSEWTSIN